MDAALAFLRRAAALLPAHPDLAVYAPSPAPMARVASLERAQLLLQSPTRAALHACLNDWTSQLDSIRPRVTRWSLDIDPLAF